MEVQASQEIVRMKRGLGILDTIITLAPMLGILGTVTGIIQSFDLLGSSGVEDPTGVTAGIAEALITTAAGLLIALAAVIPQSVYNKWSDGIELEIEEASGEILEFILTRH